MSQDITQTDAKNWLPVLTDLRHQWKFLFDQTIPEETKDGFVSHETAMQLFTECFQEMAKHLSSGELQQVIKPSIAVMDDHAHAVVSPVKVSERSVIPGAPHIAYRDGELYMEDLRLQDLAREYGTPIFVYSKASMMEALDAYTRGLSGRDAHVHYAMKANSNIAVIQLFAKAGCGFDIVSAGELDRVIAAGGDPAKVIFSGVGKTREEMRQALAAGIECFNVESEAELEVLDEVARGLGVKAPVSLRVNPNVDAQTHPYISTGLKKNKFGIAHERVVQVFQYAAKKDGLNVIGIDCHIGSQITSTGPFLDALDRVLDLVEAIETAGIPLKHIDLGGGLGINYTGEMPPSADDLWKLLFQRMNQRGHGHRKIMLEPGRSLVGNAGVCVTEVLFLKPGELRNFCIVDAGMNDIPRPAMYEAYHEILEVNDPSSSSVPELECDVVGPVCESGDWLGRDRNLRVRQGDYLAVLSTGAYCMSMASNYNTRARPVELMVDGKQVHVIRDREDSASQMLHEKLI